MKKPSPKKVSKKLWQSLEYPEWATVSLSEKGSLPRTRVYEEIDFFGLKKKEWRQMRPKKFSRDPEKQREYLIKEIRQLYKKDERELLSISFSQSYFDFRIWLPELAKTKKAKHYKTEYTLDEWYAQNYPQIASVLFRVLKDGVRVSRAGEFIDFSGEVAGDVELYENETRPWRVLKPKKFFENNWNQRQYLIKEIQKLFAKDKNKQLYRITFDETGLSEAEQSEIWPDWCATTL